MASGSSRRFGYENKLLYKIENKPMFSYALDNALELKKMLPYIIDNIIVVSKYNSIKALCHNVIYVDNLYSHKGISESLHIGLDNCDCYNSVMFMVCDQPYMKYETLYGLVKGYIESNKTMAALADNNGNTSNPCIFSPKWREELYGIKGDKGGKSVIKNNINDVFLYNVNDSRELMDIDMPFPFLNERGHIISIVGAGGKTTLMYRLAEEFVRRGHKTLVTTTTHILKPIKIYGFDVFGRECDNGKLSMPDNINECISKYDTVLIEADGAKRLPLKVPNAAEPVIISESDIVIGVVGLDSIGKPLSDVCFRLNEVMTLLNTDSGHIVSEEDIALILSSEIGTKKGVDNREYYVVLNKCRNMESAETIRDLLSEKGIYNVIIFGWEDGFYG